MPFDNLPATVDTNWLSIAFLKQFFCALKERYLLSGTYVWPTPDESPDPVFVRPIVDLPTEPEAGITYWIDSDCTNYSYAGLLATYDPDTKAWTYTYGNQAKSYFIENTLLFLVYDSNSRLIAYSPVRMTPLKAYVSGGTWRFVPTLKTYQDAAYSYFTNFLPPEYEVGADIFKKPTFSPGDFFARVTGKESMRETAVVDGIYNGWGSTQGLLAKGAPLKLLVSGGWTARIGQIATLNKTDGDGLLEWSSNEADWTFETLPADSVVWDRAGRQAYKVSGGTVTQIDYKTYCGFTRKFSLELTSLVSHIGQSYLQTGHRAVWRGQTGWSLASIYIVGPVKSKEDINHYVQDNYYARGGRYLAALIADDAIGEFKEHIGQIYVKTSFPYYYTPVDDEPFTLRFCSTNKPRECVMRHDGKWVKSGTIFEYDGEKWIVSDDQQTPETVIETFAAMAANDYAGLWMFNELYAAAKLMNRRIMPGSGLIGTGQVYEGFGESASGEAVNIALANYSLWGSNSAITSVESYSAYVQGTNAATADFRRVDLTVQSINVSPPQSGNLSVYASVYKNYIFHSQGTELSPGYNNLGSSEIVDNALQTEISVNTPASTPPPYIPDYGNYGGFAIWDAVGVLEFTGLNYV